MDYGHTIKNTPAEATPNSAPQPATLEAQAFFTAGVGNASESESPLEPENDLNLNNWETTPKSPLEVEEDIKATLVERTPDVLGQVTPNSLGQITSISELTTTPVAATVDQDLVRADGDRISRAALHEVKKAESELDRTGDISSFYDEIRNLTTDYLNNTFSVTSAAKDLTPVKTIQKGAA